MQERITWTNSTRKLRDLIPWAINPALIGKDEARRLEESLDQFGQVQAIAISPTNEIYDGHQRQAVWGASKKFGMDYEVDVRISSRPLTEDERKKLVIYLRKGAVGQFDFDILANNWEFDELVEWGFDEKELLGAGFEQDEAKGEDPGAQIDKAEELRQKWGVETGQLWKLGEHRLICGDCTDKSVVDRVMGGEKAELLFTSPPYADMRDYADEADLSLEKLVNFIPIFSKYCNYQVVNLGLQRKDGEVSEYWNEYINSARRSGYKLLSWNVWNKSEMGGSIGNQTAMFPIWHEWLFVFGARVKEINRTRENKTAGSKAGTNRQKDGTSVRGHGITQEFGKIGTVISVGTADGKLHPAMFPIELPVEYIKAMTNPGDIVDEPFSGSGTTLIACERLSRRCRAVEISPAYCAVAIQRWVDMTGGVPELIEEN